MRVDDLHLTEEPEIFLTPAVAIRNSHNHDPIRLEGRQTGPQKRRRIGYVFQHFGQNHNIEWCLAEVLHCSYQKARVRHARRELPSVLDGARIQINPCHVVAASRQRQCQLRTIPTTYVQDADRVLWTTRKSRCDRFLYEAEPFAVGDKALRHVYFDHACAVLTQALFFDMTAVIRDPALPSLYCGTARDRW